MIAVAPINTRSSHLFQQEHDVDVARFHVGSFLLTNQLQPRAVTHIEPRIVRLPEELRETSVWNVDGFRGPILVAQYTSLAAAMDFLHCLRKIFWADMDQHTASED